MSQLRQFARATGQHSVFLGGLLADSGKGGPLCRQRLVDLISNAEGRAQEGKYDDAIARLCRAAEMTGQIAFSAEFKCSTNKVDPAVLPEESRKTAIIRAPTGARFVKHGLHETFAVLREAGDE